jgi:O-antigen/teichoic acid export membrane protein
MPLRRLIENLGPGRLGRHLSLTVVQVAAETGSLTILTFAVARIFGPELFGWLGTLMVGVQLVSMLADGLTAAQVRQVAEEEAANPAARALLAWRTLLMVGAIGALMAVLLVVGWLLVAPARVAEAGISFVLLALVASTRVGKSAAEAAARSLRDFTRPALVASILAPLHLVAALGAALAGWRVDAYLALMAAHQLAGMLVVGAGVHAAARPAMAQGLRPTRGLRNLMAIGGPLMIRGLIGFFYLKINIPLIEYYAGSVEVGYYRLAEQFFLLPMMIVGAMVAALAPRVALLSTRGDTAGLAQLTRRSYLVLGALLLPFMVIFLLNRPVLLWAFPQYAPAAVMIEIFGAVVLLKGLSAICSGALLIQGRHGGLATALSLGGALANLAAAWWAVRHHGAIGAAAATAVVHLLVAGVTIIVTHRAMGLPLFRRLPAG